MIWGANVMSCDINSARIHLTIQAQPLMNNGARDLEVSLTRLRKQPVYAFDFWLENEGQNEP